ncbi:MAG: XylR family transcriptional regulator [Akkermansiaceae bacterium]
MDSATKHLRRRILLEVETAIAPGRDMLRGIAKFVGEINRWDVHHNAGHWALHGGISGPSRIEPLSTDDHVDGIITRIYDEATTERALRYIERGIPVVDILGDHEDRSIPLVHTDDLAIADLALSHLVEQGFNRLAFCGIENTRWSILRGKHFQEKARAQGIDVAMIATSKNPQLNGSGDAERVEEWISSLSLPTGIFVSCDHIAPLVTEACARLGITVPEHLAVVGVNDDTVACNVCNPTLSSIDASHFEIGYRAARLLNLLIEGESMPATPQNIPPRELIVRDSSGQLAITDPLIARASRFINRNAGSPIGVDEVVASVPLSRRELQRRFRSLTGRTVHECILNARINIAKRLLSNPEYTIEMVAELSGFGSRQHFSKTFKTHTGSTPARFQEESVRLSPRPS